MKNKLTISISVIIGLAFASAGFAQQIQIPPEFLIANGSSSGMYQEFTKQISSVTGDVITFKEIPSHGAIENLDKLINNEVSGAFLHSDVIFFRSQTTDLSKYKTLIALFPEEVHFVALSQSKRIIGTSKGDWLGRGKQTGQPLLINSIEDLKNLKVGAAGGGFITAQVIRLQGQINYEVVSYEKGDAVLAALNSGEIDAAVFVGGAPMKNLVNLGPEYKILPIPDRTVNMLKSVYRPATVVYNKMRPDGVPTVAADCLFVARDYTKTPRLINLLKTFRKSFYEKLGELQETPGLHKKWSEVSVDEHGKWPWLEIK